MYLLKIFLESLSTANKIDSKPDWDQQIKGKIKVIIKDLNFTS
jgi:hypothetical protein|tara:strand:- start:168 stop:296 length:129 start_codon:yes stop_codon:yes gene_type:complete